MLKSSPAADTPADEAEAKAAFHLRLRARGVRDLSVLRAFEIIPRAGFVPERYAALAARDMALPIACGQTTHEPWRYALALEAFAVEPTHRVLEIGSGSGYVTAVLAQLAGEVLGLERWASLAAAAQDRLDALGLVNATVVWADGLSMPPNVGRFDRILIHAVMPDGLDLTGLLTPDGRLMAGQGGDLVILDAAGDASSLGPTNLAPLVAGLSGR